MVPLKFDNIRETLLDLKAPYDYVVVDTAGRYSREVRTGMTAADIIPVPFRPSQPDLDTLPRMMTSSLRCRTSIRRCGRWRC